MFLTNVLLNEKLLLWLLLVPIALIFILLIVAVVIRIIKMNKLNKVYKGPIEDNEKQEQFYSFYGGRDNIVSINRELSRITVEVKDIDLLVTDDLKDFGATGVLITGNVVKASFGDRAETIYNAIKL